MKKASHFTLEAGEKEQSDIRYYFIMYKWKLSSPISGNLEKVYLI